MILKEALKHCLLLYGIILLFGLVLTIDTFYIGIGFGSLLWPNALIVSVIIPLIYAFLIKNRSIKELLILTTLFVIISSTISYASNLGLRGFIIAQSDTASFIGLIFGSTPASSLSLAICSSIVDLSDFNAKCSFTNNNIGDFIVFYLITFIIVFPSLLIGQILSKFRVQKLTKAPSS